MSESSEKGKSLGEIAEIIQDMALRYKSAEKKGKAIWITTLELQILIDAEVAAARIDELEFLRNHLLGDLYDENDTDFEYYKPLRDKLSKRIETLRSKLSEGVDKDK